MSETILLRGMTWDHSRGFDPMIATSKRFSEMHPGVEIAWEKRSLQAFADRPISEMATDYDFMVIDHPHVGEVADSGYLMAFDDLGHDDELAELAAQSVGPSHMSYNYGGKQWGLAIDAATPVAAFRSDLLEAAPKSWCQVVELARQQKVGFALIPINALMTFFGLARNKAFNMAEEADRLMDRQAAAETLDTLLEIADLVDPRCFALDPIGIYDWMGGSEDAPEYSPFGYGYTNYSREGYCKFPLTFADAPGFDDNGPRGTVIGGTGIAISSQCKHMSVAAEYAFWIAGADAQCGLFFESGGQPGSAVAWENDACNQASRNFFRNTRATLESVWLRPRYDGYMGFQEDGGNILHACLLGDLSAEAALDALDQAYRESRS